MIGSTQVCPHHQIPARESLSEGDTVVVVVATGTGVARCTIFNFPHLTVLLSINFFPYFFLLPFLSHQNKMIYWIIIIIGVSFLSVSISNPLYKIVIKKLCKVNNNDLVDGLLVLKYSNQNFSSPIL